MNLTTTFNQDYHPGVAVKPVIGIAVPETRRTSRQHRGFFYVRQHGIPMGGLCGERKLSPEPCPGTATHIVPPTRLQSGQRKS